MAFQSLNDFLNMGGFASYVWPAYLICALSMGMYAWNSVKHYRKTIHRLKKKI